MNKILKVGDRVRNIRADVYKDEPIVIVEKNKGPFNRYHIKYLNVYTVSGTNMVNWVDGGDITLDIEYYRNLKIENILK
jgi:hypothetical protein